MNRFSPVIITLRGEINSQSASKFCNAVAMASGRDIEVRIDSPGGCVASMTRMCSALVRHRGAVTTVCTGQASSAAGILFLMGRRRKMTPDARFMMHDARSPLYGETAHTRRISNLLACVISRAANVGDSQARLWMRETTYIDAAHALRLGLATGLASESLQTSKPSGHCKAPRTATWEELRESRLSLRSRPAPASAKKRGPIVVPPPPPAIREGMRKASSHLAYPRSAFR